MAKQKLSLGESLVREGILTSEQLKKAEAEEKKLGLHLRQVLVKMGFITEEDLVEFLSGKLGIPHIELANYLIDPKIVELVPESLARKYDLIPVLKIGNRLTCAMADPWNVLAADEVRMMTQLIVEPAVAAETQIKKSLDQYYGAKGTMEEVIRSIQEEKISVKDAPSLDSKKLKVIAEEPVVIKLVNLIILKAIKDGASDIHIEPEDEVLKIRLRVDGMLHEITAPPKHLQSAIISRIKVMANLDIAERRVSQDGRFTLKMEGKEIDIRVSCVPTLYGENLVLRLLDLSTALLNLRDMGFSKDILEKHEKLIFRPHGMVLVTGPTGSGKTTTLYASLSKINTVEKNIITIEDPVEYKLGGIRQIQVNPKVDLTFSNGLRSILRQDPDVIMVGEIRDQDTAEIAVHAALTGHLVFSTLHTNDAAGAVGRLLDMGVESFLLSSAVIGVLAQRLVRVICGDCKESMPLSVEEKKILGGDCKVFRGKGCDKCLQTGYRGRVGIFELILIDEKMASLIAAKAPKEEIKKYTRGLGMKTLREDGLEKVRQGLTTVEEVLRVTEDE